MDGDLLRSGLPCFRSQNIYRDLGFHCSRDLCVVFVLLS